MLERPGAGHGGLRSCPELLVGSVRPGHGGSPHVDRAPIEIDKDQRPVPGTAQKLTLLVSANIEANGALATSAWLSDWVMRGSESRSRPKAATASPWDQVPCTGVWRSNRFHSVIHACMPGPSSLRADARRAAKRRPGASSTAAAARPARGSSGAARLERKYG